MATSRQSPQPWLAACARRRQGHLHRDHRRRPRTHNPETITNQAQELQRLDLARHMSAVAGPGRDVFGPERPGGDHVGELAKEALEAGRLITSIMRAGTLPAFHIACILPRSLVK